LDVLQKGYFDYYYEKFNETISIGRPKITANNIVIGTLYLDVIDVIDVINHRTGEKAKIQFMGCGWSTFSTLTGQIYDAFGKERYTLKGSWLDKVILVDSITLQEEVIYQEAPSLPDASRMFGFGRVSVNLNYINEELRQQLPPSDTRLRGDQRLYE
jgi:hypothetical protein